MLLHTGESILVLNSNEKNFADKLIHLELPQLRSMLLFDDDEPTSAELKKALLEVRV